MSVLYEKRVHDLLDRMNRLELKVAELEGIRAVERQRTLREAEQEVESSRCQEDALERIRRLRKGEECG